MKSQDTHAQNSEQTANNASALNPDLDSVKSTSDLGAVSASSALITLFKKAADHLEPHELEHLANMDDVVACEVDNLSDHLRSLGCFFTGADQIDTPDHQSIGSIMFGLSHQLDTIRGLMFVASEASYRLAQSKNAGQ